MGKDLDILDGAVRIISLGGIGEIGKNMTLFAQGGEMIAVDCGLMFPDEDHPGIDLILPDWSFVRQNAEHLAGIVLTHGHEDHIGALPYFLEEMPAKIYGTRLTLGLLESKLAEYHPVEGYELIEIEAGETFRVGPFEIEAVRQSHSIPDAVALAIHTAAGVVLHSGDFKFDQTPIRGAGPDFQRLAGLGSEGVLCLIADCTNVERPGFSPSEKTVGDTLRTLLRDAPGRVIVTTFASNIMRVQQVIDESAAAGRKVAITGRSLERILPTAENLGYLHVPDDCMIDVNTVTHYPPEQVTIVTTGSQGEPLAALSRMARGSHRHVKIVPGDTVIMSATPIPGNESLIWQVINRLFGQGARVIYGADQGVHASGHGYREELKLLLSLTQPQFLVPAHGDQRHQALFCDLAKEMGLADDRIFILQSGNALELRNGKGYRGPNVAVGQINVDGLGVGDVGDIVLNDRQILSNEGIFLPVLVIERNTCRLLAPPEIYSRGFVYMDEAEELLAEARQRLAQLAEDFVEEGDPNPEELYARVRSAMSRYLYDLTERRPMVLPVIVPVGEGLPEEFDEGDDDDDTDLLDEDERWQDI